MRQRRRLIASLLAALGCGLLLHAIYIPVKAHAAQVLLQRAWDASRISGKSTRPWPWADTRPVARLRQGRLGVDQVILAGSSGRTLAFAPGWVSAVIPGSKGNAVLSGHRDTHFRWLSQVVPGDAIELETISGSRRLYRVVERRVHHASATYLLDPSLADRLLLMTCYPFDAIDPGTSWRFTVEARPASH